MLLAAADVMLMLTGHAQVADMVVVNKADGDLQTCVAVGIKWLRVKNAGGGHSSHAYCVLPSARCAVAPSSEPHATPPQTFGVPCSLRGVSTRAGSQRCVPPSCVARACCTQCTHEELR